MDKKNPRSNSLVYLLERSTRQTKLLLQHEFDQAGLKISVDQWIVLTRIAEVPAQNHKQIANSTAKDPASITRILSILISEKLVKKVNDKHDHRSVLVFPTLLGINILVKCKSKVESFRKVASKGLSQDDLNTLKQLLDKLFENSGGRLI